MDAEAYFPMNLIVFGFLFAMLGIGMIFGGIKLRVEDARARVATVQAKVAEEEAIPKEPPPGFCIVTDGKKFRAMRTGAVQIVIKDGDADEGYDKPAGALKRAWGQYEHERRPAPKPSEDDYWVKFTAEQERLKASFKPVPELCKELPVSPAL